MRDCKDIKWIAPDRLVPGGYHRSRLENLLRKVSDANA